jgi:hypothetical protein
VSTSAPRPARTGRTPRPRLLASAAALLILSGIVPLTTVGAADSHAPVADGAGRPSVQYEEAMAHAADKTTFAPGGRVTVPFKPRASDRWVVGGVAPKALPAGRLSGKALRDGAKGPRVAPAGEPSAAVGPADLPYLKRAASIPIDLAAAVDAGGL